MKKKSLKLVVLASVVLILGLVACNKENPMDVDASFTVENIDALRAGTAVNIIWDGSGEFATFYSGVDGAVWEEEGAKGVAVSGGSISVNYAAAGEYTVTIVASSFGNWSEDEVMDVKQQSITVQDDRNEISKFVLTDLKMVGTIIGNDITFLVADNADVTALSAAIDLTSPDSKVYVGGVEQVNKKTENDYTNPVIFEIVAPNGSINNYTVTVNTYEASDDADILTFGMVDHPREADIDAGAKEVHLYVPYTIELTDVKVIATVSELAVPSIGGKEIRSNGTDFDISTQPTVVTVTSESGATVDWDLYTAHELAFTEFMFGGLIPEVSGDIDSLNLTVDLNVLEGTDLSALVADFTLTEAGSVEVGGVAQTSGATANDFSSPILYDLILGDKTYQYTVTVNTISK